MDQLKQLTTLGLGDSAAFIAVVLGYALYRYAVTYGFLVRVSQILRLKAGMRFVHRSFDLIHYTVSLCLGLLALVGRPYHGCVYWARDCEVPLLPSAGAFVCTSLEKVYYMLFCAYYIVDIFFLWTTPNDVIAMTCHHATTVAMVLFAVALRLPGIGLSVMVLHDLVDVPLYLGKVAGYLGWRLTKNVGMLAFLFGCTWFRMVNFPLILYHTWRNLPQVSHLVTLYIITSSLLALLFCIHVFWYGKVVKAVMAVFHEGDRGLRDTRSD
jgi:hypothetical protein